MTENSESDAQKAFARRLAVLHVEIDELLSDSFRRQESVSNKASFLAVSVGIVLTGLTSQAWKTPTIVLLSALTLAIVSLALAASALVPGNRSVLDGQRLVDIFLDSTASRVSMETEILKSKVQILASRNARVERQALIVIFGFWFLVGSAVVFGAGLTFHYLSN